MKFIVFNKDISKIKKINLYLLIKYKIKKINAGLRQLLGTPLLMHPSYSQGRVWRKINPPYLHPPFIDWIHGLVRAPGPTNERGSYDLSRWLFQLGDQLSITTSSPSPR